MIYVCILPQSFLLKGLYLLDEELAESHLSQIALILEAHFDMLSCNLFRRVSNARKEGVLEGLLDCQPLPRIKYYRLLQQIYCFFWNLREFATQVRFLLVWKGFQVFSGFVIRYEGDVFFSWSANSGEYHIQLILFAMREST